MITAQDVGKQILNTTQGQIVSDCVHFISDKTLSGLKLNVDFGLFIISPTSSAKLAPGFTITYPNIAGTYPLIFSAIPQKYQNLNASISVINSKEFVVEFDIINMADINSYIQIGTINDNANYFIQKSIGSGTSVYDQGKYLDIKVTVQFPHTLETANSSILYNAKPWKLDPDFELFTNYFEFTAKKATGWSDLEDLTVFFNHTGSLLNSKWWGGIIKTSGKNVLPFWNDLNMQYAELGDIPIPVDVLFDSSYIIDSSGMSVGDTDTFSGYFTISKDYFEAGETYQLFFIYEDSGEYYSYLSSPIEQQINNEFPDIAGDLEFEIDLTDDNINLSVSNQCITGVAPCQKVKACVTLDIPSFNANMIANDLPYTFDEVYLGFGSVTNDQGGVFVYFTDHLQLESPDIFSNFDSITVTRVEGVSFKVCVEFTIPESFAGTTKYLFIQYKLILPTKQYIYPTIPMMFEVVDFGEFPMLIGDELNYVCDNEISNFNFESDAAFNSFTVKDGSKTLIESGLGSNDIDFTGDDANIEIDYSKLEYDEIRCLCLIAQRVGTITNPLDCVCDEIKCTYVLKDFVNSSYSLVLDWSLLHIYSDIEILSVTLMYPNGGQMVWDELASGHVAVTFSKTFGYNYTFIVNLKNGCTFTSSRYIPSSNTYISFLICNDPVPPPILGLPCLNNPYLDTICNGLFAESVLNLATGTLIEWKWTYDLDNGPWEDYTVPIEFLDNEAVYFYAIVQFTGSSTCGDRTMYSSLAAKDCIDCSEPVPVSQCSDYLVITEDYDQVLELLSLTSTIDTACVSPDDTGLFWSYDGVEYISYTDVIDTSGQNFVYYYQTIICEDGCEVNNIGIWDRSCPIEPCSTPVDLGACAVSIEHEIITVDYDSIHYNPDLGIGNESFDSHFIIQSPYSDRTVIESRIRVDTIDPSLNNIPIQTCFFKRVGFYESKYFNKTANSLQSGGIITNIRLTRFIAASNSISAYNLDCSSIVFSGSGSSYAAALKAFIIADLTSAFSYTNGTHYRIQVTCTSAGVFAIVFDFKDATDGVDWLGIDKANATVSFIRNGVSPTVTLTEADAIPDKQGCPLYLLLDNLDCNYALSCGGQLQFRAIPDGDTDCLGGNYAYILDSNQLNFHSVPLIFETYTLDPVTVLEGTCYRHRLIGLTENFTSPITFEWKDSNGDIVTVSRVLETSVSDTYTFKAYGANGCIVSRSINIGI